MIIPSASKSTEELSSLRTSLLPNLLGIVARAYATGTRNIALFEVGSVYERSGWRKYHEPLRITGGADWLRHARKPGHSRRMHVPMDFFYAKGRGRKPAPRLWDRGGRDHLTHPRLRALTHSGRAAQITVGTTNLWGYACGTLGNRGGNPRRWICRAGSTSLTWTGTPCNAFPGDTRIRYHALPRFPAVTRDLAPVFSTDNRRYARTSTGSPPMRRASFWNRSTSPTST